ncbi:hypothetical protein [Marinobacter sp.]|uniref:hypothetical protein n=1 Tax=Marinobacter sp. TaxID=50741 RepID=UPI002B27721A|nr:hypothetical protein [Marinobacter sp.]
MTQIAQGSFKKKLLALAVLAPAMAITACSNDGAYVPGSGADEKSGVAYDGYLRGATVCADVNLNKKCDADEPSTTSLEGGLFVLSGLTPAELLYPMALEAKAGVTIDEDTGEAVEDDFIYVAPADAKTVSGFSTIIQVETERLIATGKTPAEAKAEAKADLAAKLGAPAGTDLADFDAVAVSKANNSDSNFATQLRVVNQVITKQLVAAVKSAPAGDQSAVLAAATNKVTEKVATIKALVDEKLEKAGVTGPDITGEKIGEITAETVEEPTAKPEVVSEQDVTDAAEAVKKAQEAIKEAIEEEVEEQQPEPEKPATGGTGGTGGSNGGQGTN